MLKFKILVLSLVLLMFTGCFNSKGDLVEDYLEYVSEKDMDGILNSVGAKDGKYINELIDRCKKEMHDKKKKITKINTYIYSRDNMSQSDSNNFDIQTKLKRNGSEYTDKLPTPEEIIDNADMEDEFREYFEKFLEYAEDDSRNKEDYKIMVFNWYNEFYTDSSFCEMQTLNTLTYDEINIIETKDVSADEVTVRYEVVSDDGISKKSSMNIEKMNGDWKVAGRPFIKNNYFFSW